MAQFLIVTLDIRFLKYYDIFINPTPVKLLWLLDLNTKFRQFANSLARQSIPLP
jgi:hypothetical protein